MFFFMRFFGYGFAVLVMMSASSALGAEDCSQAPNQMEINLCVQRAYDQADSALQKTYNSLMKKLPPEGAAQLRDAQRGWVSYKENWCKFQSAMTKDGSMYPSVLARCLTELTNAQLERLKYQDTCTEDVDCSPKK